MGSRSPFVQPRIARLHLVDVHQRALEKLETQTLPKKATEAELSAARDAVAQAKEDAYYVDVKAELNAGEQRRVFTDMVRDGAFVAGEKPILDMRQVGLSKMTQYIVGWNFADAAGVPVPFSESALLNLELSVFNAIDAAVNWHEEQADKARAERKNVRGTEKPSLVTSPLLDGAIGVSSGSEN